MTAAADAPDEGSCAIASAPARLEIPPFALVYERHFAFLWRSARRLGVTEDAVDDVVQEAFVVIHRRLPDFEGRSALKTWLFAILLHTVRDHRRTKRRKSPPASHEIDRLPADPAQAPDAKAATAQASRLLHQILDELEDDKREVFVLAELEQMAAPEIAEALSIPQNTVYSRLRVARAAFERAVARLRARDEWRLK